MLIEFFVAGNPVPKQSFRYTANGGGFSDPRVKAWQESVSWAARQAMAGRKLIAGSVVVELIFTLPDRRRRDWDNLAKGVMDGLNGIVFEDDSQVEEATVKKLYSLPAGVNVTVISTGEAESGPRITDRQALKMLFR